MKNDDAPQIGQTLDASRAGIRVFGAPERLVASARKSRLRRDSLGVDLIEDGIIPRAVPHKIRILDSASDWHFDGWKGGVYDRNRDVCRASLSERDFTLVSAPFEPNEIDLGNIEHISGEAVYMGLAFKHFGHFLLESTNRLWWPIAEKFDGPIVFQNTIGRERLPVFARQFIDLLGLGDRVIVTDRTLRFDRVIVPHSAFTIRASLHPAFRVPFLAAGEAAERHAHLIEGDVSHRAAGLYLSRTRYGYRRALNEQRVENAFARNGFDIFYMEEMSMAEQVLVMRRYKTIAGIAGSAFHTMLFSDESKNAIYINRDYDINENFFMIDELMANKATYIYNGAAAEAQAVRTDRGAIAKAYHSDTTLDVKKIFALLEESRALAAPWRWRGY